MLRTTSLTKLSAIAAAIGMSVSADAVTFQLVTQLDTAALNAGVPGSVAAYGDTVYVGNLFGGGQLHRIADPLGSPSNANTFGGLTAPGPTTNGYVSLNTDGRTLVAATNNGGGDPDILQAYTFGADTLNFAGDSSAGSLNVSGDRIDGAAVDPINGNVNASAFGSGNQHLFDATTGAAVAGATSVIFDSGVGTGWRDLDYDNATGDLFLRAVGGVARGLRVGATNGDYTKLDGVTAGIQTIVNLSDGFNSAINVEFLPADFAGGQELVILNFRNGANTFNDQVLVYDATAVDSPVAATFLAADGSAFTTTDAGSGIYDFSYDPVNSLLYVSDFSTSQVHVFGFIPEPSTGLLISMAGVGLAVRRR